jgi:hypothetical protein
MIKKLDFGKSRNNGFCLFDIKIAHSVCSFMAWYDADGNLLDSEKKTRAGVYRTCTGSQNAYLGKLGAIWKSGEQQKVSK